MYVVSKYVKEPKLSLMDIFLNRANYEAVTFNRTYEYNHLPKELNCEDNISQYKNMLRIWFNKYGNLMNKINTKEYDYELQVELQSKFKKDIKSNGFNGSKESLDLLVGGEVEKELNNRGLKYCELYNTFFIPKKKKKNGHIKWRRIDAPTPMFKQALKELSDIFDKLMEGRSNHTAAYAYIKGRSIKDAEEKHQKHGSRWYLKLDLKDFFGSTTPKFVYDMFSQIYPFCEIVKNPEGDSLLRKCLSLCFLDGKLPQGTPISPIITNIMMIPIDHKIQNGLTYEQAYKEVEKYEAELKRQSELSDEEWSLEQIDNELNYWRDITNASPQEVAIVRKYILSQGDVVELECKHFRDGLKWKKEHQKRWNSLPDDIFLSLRLKEQRNDK